MKTIILKLGGSIFMPEHIDTSYIKNLKFLIENYSKTNRFVIIVGGGVTARKYQNALKEIGVDDNLTGDLMGIDATKINAKMFSYIFNNAKILESLDSDIPNTNIVIAHGYEPGHSTDFDTMYLASRFEDKIIIVLSNIEQIYTGDPRKDPSAKPINNMTWEELNNIVGDEWKPGLNVPMDPKSVKEGMKQKVKVVFADGKNLENLENILNNKEYIGTTIN